MKNFYVLRLMLGVLLLTVSSFAFSRKCSVCIINSYGEQSFLYLDEYKPGMWNVTGTHDYSMYGGTVWPVTGTYSCFTKKLYYVATNPDPDNCALWANQVTFDYNVDDTALAGNFINSCGMSKAFSAVANMGKCKAVEQMMRKSGEFGTSGSAKSNRSLLKLPKGEKLNEALKDKSVNVQITPNPARQFANISFELATAKKVKVSIYDMQGNLVQHLADAALAAGKHNYQWNLQSMKGTPAKGGYYWVRIVTDAGITSKQLFVDK